ncbi:hypothetical protein B0H11DRAFT_1679450, partial [Mycena galericulata]
RRNLVSPTWKDPEKLEFFELSLKSGSYAKSWYNKLIATDKDTFAHLVTAFQKQWPEKEMAIREKGELQEELLSLKLQPEEVGVRVEEDGIEEWGQVRWAIKVAEIAARIEDDGGLIPQALKNIPDSLLLRLGPKRRTWAELRRQSQPQTPTRGLSTAFSGMAASSPARPDPVRRVLFPQAPAAAAAGGRVYRPDADRLRMILAAAVTIHPRNQAGLAAYTQQMAAYTQKHGTLKPSEERPYPLTPGTVTVGSGECHKCGMMGHFSAECTAAVNLLIPDIEVRWRQIVQSIRTRAARTGNTVAVNIVADADEDIFGTAEYDQAVIDEYLRTQGKAEGPS